MEENSEKEDWLKLGVAATLSRNYASDQRVFFGMLSEMLRNAFPEAIKIKHQGLFSKKIKSVSVSLGDYTYTLEDPGKGGLSSFRSHIVKGIAIKNEEMKMEEWIKEFGAALEKHAKTNAQVRNALSDLLS